MLLEETSKKEIIELPTMGENLKFLLQRDTGLFRNYENQQSA